MWGGGASWPKNHKSVIPHHKYKFFLVTPGPGPGPEGHEGLARPSKDPARGAGALRAGPTGSLRCLLIVIFSEFPDMSFRFRFNFVPSSFQVRSDFVPGFLQKASKVMMRYNGFGIENVTF